ncbi:preprotein translocase subunit SecE [Candidatus Falkowbacteria bacterium RIFOXYD2_FULL_35_9]|uniref:Protein translocase subunit SecE n=1 Tax=Candidatus Falkowbacteria bacterium RIFOXYC2_FULL_36_12 TaxID=1798002 RepID=A0A1F5SYS6_9BACT|nr:MAG: preprotein translocase subunit SecE [Candidatus Falkowbacteria bacterium RIFOXYB2_FULL_35_7]OGF31809.1 MAG: preprotein translocase subunit SecE [Candidatus Falkowbacteria bacterium RIFOXYC2_FULL_36_12]OGF33781.1 MAG: preprotein translocase subunit SecE [Candidatus Falkowbacteria bacterium RIFOXYA2_FULL_35_8]OGF46315.1 MAG: preprotein translocase subunit SecE [Candidatus Falkowbacteria bacterium RIFOXYD2_FULL_35_9]
MDWKKNKLATYLIESKKELKKVTWPTKKETTKYTLIVIGISLFIAVFFGALDFVFSTLVGLVISS